MKRHQHIDMIATIVRGLGDLKDDVVFVGGATVGFHISDPGAPEIRLSEDVDCVIEITSRNRYYELDEKLRRRGFKDPRGEDHPLCRYEYSGVIVDIMPTDEKILGFSNRWYREGIKNAKKVELPDGTEIAIFSAPYLFASKSEAFKGRGHNDFLGSADMEDIIALVDGCETLKNEINQASPAIKTYLSEEIHKLLKEDGFVEAVRAHIESARAQGNRTERALSLLQEIAGLN